MHRRPILTLGVVIFLGIGVFWVVFSQPAIRAVSAQSPKASTAPAHPTKTLSDQTPAKDDTAVIFYVQDPDTLNPLTSNDNVSEELLKLSYEYLAQRRYDDPTKWEPLLAESWDFDRDKLEYTIHLRKGVMWHPIKLPNGKELPATELTAADVKFTFDCLFNKYVEASHYRSYYEDSEAKDEAHKLRMKVSLVPGDKYTVKMRWSKPYFLMDDWSLWSIFIIPRHVFSVNENGEPISLDVSSKEFANGFNNHWANKLGCGTGPMMLTKWIKDRQVEFQRNPNYWGAPYYFSRVIYRTNSNLNTALQETLQGQYDHALIPQKDQYVQSKTHPNVLSGKVKLVDYFYPAYRYIGYNENREFFKDKRVRWALSHAVPVDQIVDKVFHKLAVRVTGPFQVGSPANDETLPPVDFDLEKSKKLLDEAGWIDSNGDGIRDKMIDGQRVDASFDFMIYSDIEAYQTIAEIVKQNCRKIGVEVKISPAKWDLMLQKLRKKEYDATMLGWTMDWKNDPFQIFHSSQADLPDTSNNINYKNPAVDRLIEKLRVTIDDDEQNKIFKQIHKLIYDDQPYTFLFADKETAGEDARMQNIKFYTLRPAFDSRLWYSSAPRMMGQ